MAPHDDLTAEWANLKEIARKLVLQINEITPVQWDKHDDKDQAIILAALKTTRQEALREAITKIRQRGDEYMRDCESKDASGKKYRDTSEMRRVNSGRAWAFKDLADELDRLTSEGA